MRRPIKLILFWAVVLIASVLLWQIMRNNSEEQKIPEVSYSEFLSRVEAGEVDGVWISKTLIHGRYRDGKSFRLNGPATQDAMLEILRKKTARRGPASSPPL